MSLTFIAGYRDRDDERLRRSLDSLKNQTCSDFDMILLDYGSSSRWSSEIQKLVRNYPFSKYYYSDTRGWLWNRSAALNTGARLAKGDYLFLTDVDIIYPPWFVERVLEHAAANVFFTSSCYRCPQEFEAWDSLARNGSGHSWPEMKGKGLLCCPRRGLEAVAGLDEGFACWGQEDHDFAERLVRAGFQELTVEGKLTSYHQWHPRVIYQMPLTVQFHNLAQYYRGRATSRIEANEQLHWGKLTGREQRPIFQHIDAEMGTLLPNSRCEKLEVFGVGNVATALDRMAGSSRKVWALPVYAASDTDAAFLNKILRRLGWRLDRRVGLASDAAQGLLMAVPGLFRDYFLQGRLEHQPCAFFLT